MKALLVASVLAMSAASAQAADAPTFRLCTGNEAGNYFRAGHVLKSKASSLKVEVVQTQGSLDNLDKVVAGQCDGAFVQSDALLVYSARNAAALSSIERAGILYQEQAHLLCNRSAKIGRIVDLTKANTIAVGPDGSGARTTWDGFVLADKKRYAPVQIDTRAGVRALSAVADGSQVQCMLWVGALNASFVKTDAQAQGDRIVLAGTDDRDMAHTRDARGQLVYAYGEIPAGTYPRIQPGGTLYGTKAIGTISVDALFVTGLAWVNANERSYDALLRAFAAAKPAIATLVQPQ
ncbi:TAXI family TRAP transporter solute-binding subunit [Methylobacterium aquaticum]|uniref:TAXI family TRAP transporter solute-binding subunit n=1 Tax=Methylobacterium aquaticum TaxID=270351 RepID=UPI001933AB5C|nr:TAXI family TRAP transporter solute-binding subunit [Methylobacterium aquaticum]QRE76500.1 TRAP transporter substrate-binding protein [Methylobacterium aquaticum]